MIFRTMLLTMISSVFWSLFQKSKFINLRHWLWKNETFILGAQPRFRSPQTLRGDTDREIASSC